MKLVLEHADTGFIHRQAREHLRGLGLAKLPGDRLTHLVDSVLRPVLDLLERDARTLIHRLYVVHFGLCRGY